MHPLASQRAGQGDAVGEQLPAGAQGLALGVEIQALGGENRQIIGKPLQIAVEGEAQCRLARLLPLGEEGDALLGGAVGRQGVLDLLKGGQDGLLVAGQVLTEDRAVAFDLGRSAAAVEDRLRQVDGDVPEGADDVAGGEGGAQVPVVGQQVDRGKTLGDGGGNPRVACLQAKQGRLDVGPAGQKLRGEAGRELLGGPRQNRQAAGSRTFGVASEQNRQGMLGGRQGVLELRAAGARPGPSR